MTGDQSDMLARLRANLPPWFPNPAPVTDGALAGIAATLAFVYSLIQYAKAQTRITTAFGGWLDLIAWDFFGGRFVRRRTEMDASFRPRVLQEILRPRATRVAVAQALVDLTGRAPAIFEPWSTGDCGAYGIAGTLGYGVAGCYGSLSLKNQIFVTALRPGSFGVPNVGGYGVGLIGYGVAGEYIDMNQLAGPVTDTDIYATVAQTVAAGITAWTAIEDALPAAPVSTPITADSNTTTADSNSVTADHF